MWQVMKDPEPTSGAAARRCETAGPPEDHDDDAHPDPHADVEAPAPEEAGYGYGV
jgi:hypothetical protein